MSRISGCLWLIVGLILAVSAGGVAYVTLQRASATNANANAAVATVDVVVAARAVGITGLLQAGDLTLQTWPADLVPASAVRAVADATGKITTVPLEAGEPLLRNHLTTPDVTTGNMGFTLPAGKVAVTLAADDLVSRVQLVQTNDCVDILYTMAVKKASADSGGSSSAESDKYTFGSLQNVQVVGVIYTTVAEAGQLNITDSAAKTTGTSSISAYTLALDPQDALLLKYLRDAGATMDLALRNINDESQHTTTPVNESYVVDKYQLQVH